MGLSLRVDVECAQQMIGASTRVQEGMDGVSYQSQTGEGKEETGRGRRRGEGRDGKDKGRAESG